MQQKGVTLMSNSFLYVVPPGIEPGAQGQFIDNVSPLLYQLSYGIKTKMESLL